MIDLEQALRDQDDLQELCTRELAGASVERFAKNDGYGFARILKEYSGYPLDRSLEAVVPHGVYIDAALMLDYEREAPVPAVLNYPAFRSAAWGSVPDKTVIPAASPFAYAFAMMRERFGEGPERSGTLFFTHHTTGSMNWACDYGTVIRELSVLEPKYQPVTVCVSSVDFHQGNHRQFEESGIRVVCAGQPADPEFVWRWLHLASCHRFAAGVDFGSCAVYSVMAGLPFFLTESGRTARFNPAVYVMTPPASEQLKQTRDQLRSMLGARHDVITDEVRQTMDYLLGMQDFKSPEGLLEDLEFAASLA